jgi:hypothetical protein
MAAIKPFGNKTTEVAMSQLLSKNQIRGYGQLPAAGAQEQTLLSTV